MKKQQELTFDDFGILATNNALSPSQKIGFPDAYRKGYDAAIFHDIESKLPALRAKNSIILDIGCGCGGLAKTIMRACKKNNHTLILIDHPAVLAVLPDTRNTIKISGRFPDTTPKKYAHRIDAIIMYSVIQYIYSGGDIFRCIDEALLLLRPGGRLLIGDIPNEDARARFAHSRQGKAFSKTAKRSRKNRMTDRDIIAILTTYRARGYETYLIPQHATLPMANRREDIVIYKR